MSNSEKTKETADIEIAPDDMAHFIFLLREELGEDLREGAPAYDLQEAVLTILRAAGFSGAVIVPR